MPKPVTEPAAVLRWEEPPPAKHNGAGFGGPASRFAALADELRSRPGEWAVVCESAKAAAGLATHIRMGQMRCFTPAGDFDAVTRRVDGLTLTYARYVGDGEVADV
jgi:hypothetical protein